MSGYTRPAEARASHLANISNFYAPAQPQASSYWGSELNDLEAALDVSFKALCQRDYCHACGQIQISGVSSNTEDNTAQHIAPGAYAIRKKRKVGAGLDKVVSLTRCLHCNRYTQAPSKPAKPAKPAKDFNPKEAKKAASHMTSDPASQPSPMPSEGSEKKAKRKQKKGGLAAILARSKESASSRPAQQMLGFADLARKS